jgi:hypothetical protein
LDIGTCPVATPTPELRFPMAEPNYLFTNSAAFVPLESYGPPLLAVRVFLFFPVLVDPDPFEGFKFREELTAVVVD